MRNWQSLIANRSLFIICVIYLATLFWIPVSVSRSMDENQMIAWRTLRESGTLPGRPRSSSLHRIGISVKLNLVKVQDVSSGEAWIYNLDTRRFWLINNRKRTFSEGTFDDLAEYHYQRLTDERVKLEMAKDRMASMAEQDRKQRAKNIEQRLAILDASKRRLKVIRIDEEPIDVAGFTAEPVGVYLGEGLVETLWITQDFDMPESWRKFLKIMSEIDPPTWKAEAALKQMPVKSESNYGGVKRTWEVQTMTPGPVSIDEFSIPTNYEPTTLSDQ